LPFVKDLEATLDRIGLRAQELIQLFLSGVPKQIDKPTADALIYAAKTGMDNESRSVLKPDDPKVYTVSSLWLNDKLFNDLVTIFTQTLETNHRQRLISLDTKNSLEDRLKEILAQFPEVDDIPLEV